MEPGPKRFQHAPLHCSPANGPGSRAQPGLWTGSADGLAGGEPTWAPDSPGRGLASQGSVTGGSAVTGGSVTPAGGWKARWIFSDIGERHQSRTRV